MCPANKETVGEKNVGVIAMYKDQQATLERLLPQGVAVRTVDGFQGEERDVIV